MMVPKGWTLVEGMEGAVLNRAILYKPRSTSLIHTALDVLQKLVLSRRLGTWVLILCSPKRCIYTVVSAFSLFMTNSSYWPSKLYRCTMYTLGAGAGGCFYGTQCTELYNICNLRSTAKWVQIISESCSSLKTKVYKNDHHLKKKRQCIIYI